MKDDSRREQQLLILEAAAVADKASPDFEALLKSLDLPLAYLDIMIRALKAGRWRTSDSPNEAVRRATMRAALRRDEEGRSRREEGGYSADELGWINEIGQANLIRGKKPREADRPGITSGGDKPGIWRQGGGREDEEDLDYYTEPISYVPPDLRMAGNSDSREVPDWTKIADRAGLDQWESVALRCMARGWTRYRSLNAFDDAADKRALEAAWRRLERSNFEKVRGIFV